MAYIRNLISSIGGHLYLFYWEHYGRLNEIQESYDIKHLAESAGIRTPYDIVRCGHCGRAVPFCDIHARKRDGTSVVSDNGGLATQQYTVTKGVCTECYNELKRVDRRVLLFVLIAELLVILGAVYIFLYHKFSVGNVVALILAMFVFYVLVDGPAKNLVIFFLSRRKRKNCKL